MNPRFECLSLIVMKWPNADNKFELAEELYEWVKYVPWCTSSNTRIDILKLVFHSEEGHFLNSPREGYIGKLLERAKAYDEWVAK